MVLEALINPLKAEREPWELFFIGFIYSSIAIFFSLVIFRKESSLLSVFLIVLASIPLIYGTMKLEEKKDKKIKSEKRLLEEHGRAILFFTFLFLGITLSYVLWYVFLPQNIIVDLFGSQISAIQNVNQQITGNVVSNGLFFKVLANNIKVLILCIVFSFFYGFGAIFILTWNASVIAVAIGTYIRRFVEMAGLSYIHVFSIGIGKYLTHGIFEIIGYFIGGLAGGIISIAIIRKDYRTKKFNKILKDSLYLILISFIILVIAALVEVFVTAKVF